MSTLKDRLDRIREGFKKQAPADALALMARAQQQLADSGIMDRIPKVGDKFPVFSLPDTEGNILDSKSLQLVYSLSDELAELYKGFGIDLPANHGTSSWEVPFATRIVVDSDGTIAAIDADPDYTIRPEPSATLDLLQAF